MRLLGIAFLMGLVGFTAPAAHAQTFPERPVRLIVPWSAGSGIDVQVRTFARQFAAELGVPVVVENKSGAGSQLGYEYAARAKPDGYTILVGSNANFIHQYMRPASKIDPVAEFDAVSLIMAGPSVLVVSADSPAKDVQGLIKWGREKAGALNYGSGGVGAGSHLLASMFVNRNDFKATHVPLRTLTADLAPMLARGDFHFAFPFMAVAAGHLEQGTVRALAVTSAKRWPELPEVPTLSGVFGREDYVVENWGGLMAPAGTPPEIIKTLHAAAIKAVDTDEYRQMSATLSTAAVSSESSEEFAEFIRAESKKWHEIVRDSGIALN